MHIGELPMTVFIVSKFLSGCNRKFFGARFFEASQNENVGDFPLSKNSYCHIHNKSFYLPSQTKFILSKNSYCHIHNKSFLPLYRWNFYWAKILIAYCAIKSLRPSQKKFILSKNSYCVYRNNKISTPHRRNLSWVKIPIAYCTIVKFETLTEEIYLE